MLMISSIHDYQLPSSPGKMQSVIPVALPSSKRAHQNSNSLGETEVKLPENVS